MSIRKKLKDDLWRCRLRIKMAISSYRSYPDSDLLRRSLQSELGEYRRQKEGLAALDEYVFGLVEYRRNKKPMTPVDELDEYMKGK